MATAPKLSMRGRTVVRELKRLRDELGWTLEEASNRSGISPATISRTENGDGLRRANVAALLAAYGVDIDTTQKLLTLTKQAKRTGWWTGVAASVMSEEYKDLAELEAEASWKKSFDAWMVPGLLQTEAYAREVLASGVPDLSAADQEKLLEIRMRRQERLREIKLDAIMAEEVLVRAPGTSEVMREQLSRLIDAVGSEKVDFRILSLNWSGGYYARALGGFSLFGGFKPLDTVVAYVETPLGDICSDSEADVAKISASFERLWANCLSPEATVETLQKYLHSPQ